jgi:hypothetical protein
MPCLTTLWEMTNDIYLVVELLISLVDLMIICGLMVIWLSEAVKMWRR